MKHIKPFSKEEILGLLPRMFVTDKWTTVRFAHRNIPNCILEFKHDTAGWHATDGLGSGRPYRVKIPTDEGRVIVLSTDDSPGKCL